MSNDSAGIVSDKLFPEDDKRFGKPLIRYTRQEGKPASVVEQCLSVLRTACDTQENPSGEINMRLIAKLFGSLFDSLDASSCKWEDSVIDECLDACCRYLLSLDKASSSAIINYLSSAPFRAESARTELDNALQDAAHTHRKGKRNTVLMLVPIMMWSRYQTENAFLNERDAAAVAKLMRSMWTYGPAEDVEVKVLQQIVNASDLPTDLWSVHEMCSLMATKQKNDLAFRNIIENRFWPSGFCELRYIVVGITTMQSANTLFCNPLGTALARHDNSMQFAAYVGKILEPYYMGASVCVLPPCTYYEAVRKASETHRYYSVESLIKYAKCLDVKPSEGVLTAAIVTESDAPLDNKAIDFLRANTTLNIDFDKIEMTLTPDSMVDLRIAMCGKKSDPRHKGRPVAGVIFEVPLAEAMAVLEQIPQIAEMQGVTNRYICREPVKRPSNEIYETPQYIDADGRFATIAEMSDEQLDKLVPTLN